MKINKWNVEKHQLTRVVDWVGRQYNWPLPHEYQSPRAHFHFRQDAELVSTVSDDGPRFPCYGAFVGGWGVFPCRSPGVGFSSPVLVRSWELATHHGLRCGLWVPSGNISTLGLRSYRLGEVGEGPGTFLILVPLVGTDAPLHSNILWCPSYR